MRPIKFRAWDKKYNKMYCGGGVNIATSFPDNEVAFMQFTGLTDKNGKECYEGDLVKYENFYHHSGIGIVVFKDGTFYVEDRNIECSAFAILGKFNGEIVGNRYENSELLEGTK